MTDMTPWTAEFQEERLAGAQQARVTLYPAGPFRPGAEIGQEHGGALYHCDREDEAEGRRPAVPGGPCRMPACPEPRETGKLLCAPHLALVPAEICGLWDAARDVLIDAARAVVATAKAAEAQQARAR